LAVVEMASMATPRIVADLESREMTTMMMKMAKMMIMKVEPRIMGSWLLFSSSGPIQWALPLLPLPISFYRRLRRWEPGKYKNVLKEKIQ